MHAHDWFGAAMPMAAAGTYQHQAADAPIVEDELWRQRAGFTTEEYRRLVFLRWLYRTGRLTEWM